MSEDKSVSLMRRLAELVEIPEGERVPDWRTEFLELAEKSMWIVDVPQARTVGSFDYLSLLTLPNVKLEAEVVDWPKAVEYCTDSGCGILINSAKEKPDWVFPYGELWYYRQFKKFSKHIHPSGGAKFDHLPNEVKTRIRDTLRDKFIKDDERLIDFFEVTDKVIPSFARTVLLKFLKRFAGPVGTRVIKICMISVQGEIPPESLAFNIHESDFPSRKDFEDAVWLISWYLPKALRFTGISPNDEMFEKYGVTL